MGSKSPAFIAFDSEKGGTGKSTAGRSFASWCLARNIPVMAIDADTSNPDVARWLQESVPVHTVNLRKEGGWIEVSNIAERALDKMSTGVVLLNLPSNVAGSFPEDRAHMFAALQAMGYATTLAWVLDPGADAVNLLGNGLGPISGFLANRLVFRNLIHAESAEFKVWQGSKMRTRFLEIGGKEADFPRLWPRLANEVLHSTNPAFLRKHDRATMGIAEYFVLAAWVAAVDHLWDSLRPGLAV